MSENENNLRMLSIGYYIVAGLTFLIASLPILHIVMGILIIQGKMAGQGSGEMQRYVGWLFLFFGSAAITFGWAQAICTLIAGLYIKNHKCHTFCVVVAAINCMFMPFGTILGVFSLLVLLKPEVRQLFNSSKLMSAQQHLEFE